MSKADQARAYAEGIHILLATTVTQTDAALTDASKTRGSLEHALPTGSLALIEDENVFEARRKS